MYKLWKLLHMKTSHMMSIFGDIPLNRSENTAKMVSCVFWLFGKLTILRNDQM